MDGKGERAVSANGHRACGRALCAMCVRVFKSLHAVRGRTFWKSPQMAERGWWIVHMMVTPLSQYILS